MGETHSVDNELDQQAARLHQHMVELIKKYQFRDRGTCCCYGVSISQCYILETLAREGALTMKELAARMHLSVSTLTRVVGQLVTKDYVTRLEDDRDRRVRRVELTPQGREMSRRLWAAVFQSEKEILENFPPQHRELLVRFLKQLNRAVDSWRLQCR